MGRPQHGKPGRRHDLADVPNQIAPRRGIKAGGRFIQQQRLGFGQHRAGNLGPALIAAGQTAYRLVQQRLDIHQGGNGPYPFLQPPPEQAEQTAKEFEVGPHGNVGIQRPGLKHDAKLAVDQRGIAPVI